MWLNLGVLVLQVILKAFGLFMPEHSDAARKAVGDVHAAYRKATDSGDTSDLESLP